MLGVRGRKQSQGGGMKAEPLTRVFLPKLWAGALPKPPRLYALLPRQRCEWSPSLPGDTVPGSVTRCLCGGCKRCWALGMAQFAICSAHLLPSFRAGSCLYNGGSLLAGNNKVWYTWARRSEQQESEILQKDKLKSVFPEFVMRCFCTTGKLGLCILVNMFAQAITHLWLIIPTISQGKISFGHFCSEQLRGKTCLENEFILHSSYLH